MDNDKKISMIINLVTGICMLLAFLILVYIYRNNIFSFLGNKTTEENKNENETTPGLLLNSDSESVFESFEPDESDESEKNTTDNSEDIGFFEDTTEDSEDNGIPKSDFMRYMFDNAIKIPGSQDKIEPPPEGRDIETQYNAVPLSDIIPEPSEYFKDIIFLGDSVTSGFELYKTKIKFDGEYILKDVNVIAMKKYGAYYALQPISTTSSHPLVNGEQTLSEDIIADKEAKNIFMCLGLNDLTFAKVSDFVTYYSRLIDRIKEKSPEKNIVIMSVTPLVSGQSAEKLTNDVIIEANNALLEFAKENGIYFIDYAAAIRDDNNCLPENLSVDGYCHLTVPAYDMLVEYLLYHPIK